jgi:mycothiol synthase
LAGYGSVTPVPGLSGVYDLDGFIAPAYRRQGMGSALLETIITLSAGRAVKQLSVLVASLETPAAIFLMRRGFLVEHQEHLLVLDDLSDLPAVNLDQGFGLKTFDQPEAIVHFRRLYEASFGDQAWFQPYDDDQEVARDLASPDDLLFLTHDDRPVGFLWLRWPDLWTVEIEPVGLLPRYRGRGLGRQLMVAGLARAAEQGADQIRIGAWQANTVALNLYRQLGFQPARTTFYLALAL